MDAVSLEYPIGIGAQFQGKYGVLPFKLDAVGFNHHPSCEFSSINLSRCTRTSSNCKESIRRMCAVPNIDDFYMEETPTPLLDMIENPTHLKNLSPKELKQLAEEIRSELSSLLSKAQKPLDASLAAVELAVAIHYVFNAPVDKILWDIGDQTYAHKLLTGRRLLMETLSESNCLSGYTNSYESEYDPFGAAHGCNSISAGLGMAVARDIKVKRERIITVISNETTMAGQVYEAMSNAGYLDSNLVVILNDSRHSLHPKPEDSSKTPINALSSTLSKLQSSKTFRILRKFAKDLTKKIGKGMYEWAAKVDEYARGMIGPTGSTLFEELGLYYIGPVDGNNVEDLICVLQEVASLDSMGPVLIHVLTNEGQKKHDSLEMATSKKVDGGTVAAHSLPLREFHQTYSDCFVDSLSRLAAEEKDIVVVHAGMGRDPSFKSLVKVFPDRIFDVGMAEQHAVTFAAGLACGGLKPFCIIPSAFLQRAYDQVVHDVDRQKIPVRFAITNAGVVGSDGPVCCGAFDITFMSCLPNMIVMAPSDEIELGRMVFTAAQVNDRPVCFRYPSGAIAGLNNYSDSTIPIEIGKGKVLVEGNDVAFLGYGAMVQNCLHARSVLAKLGVNVTVADARFCKPLDIKLVRELCDNHAFLITVEEGSTGGFGSSVAQFITLDGKLDGRVQWRPMVLPDTYIESASPKGQLSQAGLSGHHIAATALSLLGRTREALLLMR